MTLKDAEKIKEAIKNSDDFVGGSDDIIKVIDSVPEVVISTDTDTIRRQRAIDALTEYGNGRAVYIAVEEAVRRIEQLPPAQPESDSGRWERHYSRPGVYADLYWHCSKCGYKTDYQYAHVNHHYCPNCGRKMERGVNDENRIHYGRDHGQQSSRPDQNKAAVFKL